MPELRFLDDSGKLRTFLLGSQPAVIGRVNSCDIVFVDDMISREHTRFEREAEGRYRVRDLGSRNKTYVNGQQITESMLIPGDVVRVGDHVLEYIEPDGQSQELTPEFLTPDSKEPADCEWVKIKSPLNLSLEHIEKLSALSTDFGLTSRAEDIADKCLSEIIVELQAERGFIAVRGEDKHSLRPIAHRGLGRTVAGSRIPVSQAFSLATILQKVAGRYPQSNKKLSYDTGYAAAAVAAPLTFRGTPIGVLYVDRPVGSQAFKPADIQYLLAAGAVVGSSMAKTAKRLNDTIGLQESAWVSSSQRAHEALTQEPEANETFDVFVKTSQGAARCGDFSDVIPIDDQSCLLTLVDAGGQGPCGLAQAVMIRTALETAGHMGDLDLASIFNMLNTRIAGLTGRQLVSCLAVVCDLSAGKLSYINAGMPPPVVLVGPGRLVTLDQPSLLLGIDSSYMYEVTSIELPGKFRLVGFTDGTIDAVNNADEAFSERRIHELLLDADAFGDTNHVGGCVHDAMMNHLSGQTPEDDTTIMVVGHG
ncbi:MAG: SpoIIE family protein phosphatase [Planctomycetes bacterium]|nr:SpoIIE family protein phosphatase [Planctomycetota bacterium]